MRIELDPKQVAEHPLRLGMSMSADVGIRDQGGKTLPVAAPAKPVLTTQAYAKQLQDADARIDTIISQNLAQGRRS